MKRPETSPAELRERNAYIEIRWKQLSDLSTTWPMKLADAGEAPARSSRCTTRRGGASATRCSLSCGRTDSEVDRQAANKYQIKISREKKPRAGRGAGSGWKCRASRVIS
jgi:hypothetical protein